MNKIDDGGPAYPGLEYSSGYGNQKFDGVLPSGDSAWSTHAPGMTLRDWYAGQALAGMCNMNLPSVTDPRQWNHEAIAVGAMMMADAMIAHKRATEASRGSNNG